MKSSSIKNPFINCTARDMSADEVVRFWCSPYKCYEIDESELFLSSTPIIVEGARGSGKTMILKHLSIDCQKMNMDSGNYLNSIIENGFLGIYFRYSANYSHFFDSIKLLDVSEKNTIIDNYLQLSLTVRLIDSLLLIEKELSDECVSNICNGFSQIISDEIDSILSIKKEIVGIIQTIDKNIRFTYQGLRYSFPEVSSTFLIDSISIVRNFIPSFNNVLVLFIIDEYENIGIYQEIVNTYIKQCEGHGYSFRIGVRPEGIIDYKTSVSNEFIQDGRDFKTFKLSLSLKDRKNKEAYKSFVENVLNTRLFEEAFFRANNIDIRKLLGYRENYKEEANSIGDKKSHFEDAYRHNKKDDNDRILEVCSFQDKITEAYFVMRYLRGMPLDEIEQLKFDIENNNYSPDFEKYKKDISNKYSVILTYWLLAKNKISKKYYSLMTYINLSCGSVYDVIGICRILFSKLDDSFFDNIQNNLPINPSIQSLAAEEYAQSQLDKVLHNQEYGQQMYNFAVNMLGLFAFYHKDDLALTYPETNQFYTVNSFYESGINRSIWKSLLNWGVIIRKQNYQRQTLSSSHKANLYYLNMIYYPIFNISPRLRGGFNVALTSNMWNDFLLKTVDPKRYIKSSETDNTVSGNKNMDQLTLWNEEEMI